MTTKHDVVDRLRAMGAVLDAHDLPGASVVNEAAATIQRQRELLVVLELRVSRLQLVVDEYGFMTGD